MYFKKEMKMVFRRIEIVYRYFVCMFYLSLEVSKIKMVFLVFKVYYI